jgi:carbon-monoxide dehydrogenase medium subunit
VRLAAAEAVVNGNGVDDTAIAAAEEAARAAIDPPDDIHGSGAYRRALIGTMIERALSASA